ncbi:MAG: hypothetical protein DI585_07185 [Pseudomonas fluorescens]|nr:MAG: hypothetical protein DI585_07185 [Pseudomonas fluorescens]
MNIPFTLTPVQHADILQVMRSYWPNAVQDSIVPNAASQNTLAVWNLSREQENNQPYENLGLILTGGELILADDGTPRFTSTKLEFIYENGIVSSGVFRQRNSLTRPTSFVTLLSPNDLRGAFQELRTLASKIPVRSNAA